MFSTYSKNKCAKIESLSNLNKLSLEKLSFNLNSMKKLVPPTKKQFRFKMCGYIASSKPIGDKRHIKSLKDDLKKRKGVGISHPSY